MFDPFTILFLGTTVAGLFFAGAATTAKTVDDRSLVNHLRSRGAALNGEWQETEFKTTLRSPAFMLAVHDFFKNGRPESEAVVPRQLWYNWWRVTERIPKARLYQAELRYLEPTDHATTEDCKVVLKVQLIPNPSSTDSRVILQWVAWASGGGSVVAPVLVDYSKKELQSHLARVGELQSTAQTNLRPTTASINSTPAANIRLVQAPEGNAWPTPQDYNEAVQNPLVAFGSDILKHGTPELNNIGLPRAATGAFASVYRIHSGGKDYAVKCFLTLPEDQKERFGLISKYVLNDDLEYTVDFAYEEKGVLVRGQWYPVLRMDWVDGLPLQFYAGTIVHDAQKLKNLADQFYEMMTKLQEAGIAHGDLQHGNVIITKEGIRLVDYDGMYVPEMSGMHSNELGHRNYQHPEREPHHFGPYLDNFSAWVIFISLRMLAIDPTLWQLPTSGDECLLFKRDDLLLPSSSTIINQLSSHRSALVRELCRFLVQLAVECDPADVPFLDARFA